MTIFAASEGTMLAPLWAWLRSLHLAHGLTIAGVLVLSFFSYFIARRVVLRLLTLLVKKTSAAWDDILLHRGVFDRMALLAPAIVLYYSVYLFPAELEGILQRVLFAYMVTVFVMTLDRLLSAIQQIYDEGAEARTVSIKGYLQIAKLTAYIVGTIFVLANLLGRSPWGLLTGIGAFTAVLLLVFKDTILSLVASVQIASNDMVRVGDWISMPRYGADGDVIDIALHTVKVQNWDKTITTIPTHRLIDESFSNWRGMSESGGRRVKRALFLDQTSVRFLSEDDVARLKDFHVLTDYLARKQKDLAEYRQAKQLGPESINARRLTNLGTFRAYVLSYLRNLETVHRDMTLLVRQLAPTPDGLPLELYFFTSTTAWADYEGIQADVFDHLLAILPHFGLRVHQRPTGLDLSLAVSSALSKTAPAGPGPA